MRIGIFAAEQQELENIRQSLQGRKIERAGLVFYEAAHGIHTVISVCGGIGKVNAAICTQLLISEFHAEIIINTGTAGGLNDALHVFDLVVSTDAVQHDVDVSVFGYAKGQVAGTSSPFWKADDALRTVLMKTFTQLKNNHAAEFAHTDKMIAGRIASGDRFIVNPAVKQEIISTFKADCVEMEGAAVAQTCVMNAIPFVILRCISDNAGEPAAISYQQFSKEASRISAMLVLHTLSLL
ncbi:5'-methylthioadenosine/adenosylhomocysteine nucleosidase [Treponema sp. OMZ 305]|uniref:5'-methylthioadenosine/adenosylhomocysteine nucleosidase n=1 Tax=Treponema sp. OMZ 305 TaxID=1659192 RepID=UPI0020A305E8|nr:5'-methylthioadenosine/adenosylhomocysteine nucleosidase [Treponema sp. OMZ 305]UTC57537.1 5'-methylthioadenosine/adenosylhomocysteine nucleosidase [Treponema sp. OMZ 305]